MKKKIFYFLILLLINLGVVIAQSRVTGNVIDERGEPVIGASIQIKGTGQGAVSDANGNFSLNVPSGYNTLVISYVGMKTREMSVSSNMTIALQDDNELLSEIVVVGYGVQHKEEITSSITQVKVNNGSIKNIISPLEVLKGQVPGLIMVRPDGGDVNGDVQMQLRGVTSLSGGLSPLVVVDGIVGVNLNNVIMEEIESISVLKDGSAAAIYGTRGTNGVILITTKKNQSRKLRTEFSSFLSTQTVARKLETLSSSEFREALKLKYTPEEIANLDKGSDTDWFDVVTRTPLDQYYNISFSSGTDKLSYRAAVNYKNSQGLVKENINEVLRTNVSVFQKLLNDKVDVNYNITFSNTYKKYTDKNVLHQAFHRNPTEPVYDAENTFAGGYYLNLSQLTYYNPVAMINERDSNADWQYFTGSTKIDYHIIDGLTASAMGSIITNSWKSNGYSTRYYPVALGTNGSASITSHLNISNQLDLNVLYNKSFNKHNFDAILGYSYYENKDEEFGGSNSDFDTDFFSYNNIGAGYYLTKGLASLNSWKSSNKLISFYARTQYNYDLKYLLSLALRREGSTRFGENNKWGMFPSVSFGWRLDREPFMENYSWISILKPRVGVGVTGNQEIGDYRSLSLLSNSGGKMYYNGRWINTYAPASNPNPDLKWETKTEYNAGIDFGFLEGRITGALDFFIRNTDNLLWTYDVPVPPNLYPTTYDNVGKIQNKGFEFTLSADVVNTKDFLWNSKLLYSMTKNKLISFSDVSRGYEMEYLKTGWISEDIQTWTHYVTEGNTLGNFYAKVYEGVNENGEPIYKEIDGEEGISDADREVVGNAYPKFQMSLNNNITYKGFDMNLLFRGSYGNSVLNIHRAYYDNIAYLGGKNTLKMALDNPNYKGGPDYSSRYVEDASFIKLDNLTLGYTFFLNNPYINSLRVYLSGQNLLTVTKYKGLDPEVGILGLAPGVDSYYYYPRTKVYTAGINIIF